MTGTNAPALRERYGNFIDGAERPARAGRSFEADDPSTGRPLASFALSDASDVADAVDSAARAWPRWLALKPARRAQILTDVARAIRAQADALATLETRDTGKPLSLSRGDVETCARYFEYYGGVADKILGETIPASNEHLLYTLREPYGVTGHITPWNAPINQAGRGAAVALAAGNVVVMKPSELASITTIELATLCTQCGVPAGAFNVVTGTGPEAGDALARHAAVRKLAFTGSVATGRRILARAAERIVPVTAELGGKSAYVVFADADLDAAATLTIKAFIRNTGQVCSAGTRLLVEASAVPEFSARVADVLRGVTVGPGMADPTMGPVISDTQRARVSRYVDVARREGARLAYCGALPAGEDARGGYYVAPMLLGDVRNDMTVAREEIFGPVACVIPFSGEDEAVALANDSEYGLAGAVWTQSLARGHRVAAALQAGQVYLNDYMPVGVEMPFGGYKASGYGREKGLEAIREYTQVKAIAARFRG